MIEKGAREVKNTSHLESMALKWVIKDHIEENADVANTLEIRKY